MTLCTCGHEKKEHPKGFCEHLRDCGSSDFGTLQLLCNCAEFSSVLKAMQSSDKVERSGLAGIIRQEIEYSKGRTSQECCIQEIVSAILWEFQLTRRKP